MSNSLNRQLKVFLCHASSDKPKVQELYARLTSDGIDAWLDKEKLIPGQNWQIEIPKAVRNSDIVIVCLSSLSVTKDGFVQKEIKFALDAADEKPEGTIFIIPARLEDCNVPDRISQFHWVDLYTEDGYERLLNALRIRAKTLELEVKIAPKTDTLENKKIIPEIFIEKSDESEKPIPFEPQRPQTTESIIKTKNNSKSKDPSVVKRIHELERHKQSLKTSVKSGTVVVLSLGAYALFFGVVMAIAGITSFNTNDPEVILTCALIALLPTFIAVLVIYDDSKRKDKEALERTENEIQELRKKVQLKK